MPINNGMRPRMRQSHRIRPNYLSLARLFPPKVISVGPAILKGHDLQSGMRRSVPLVTSEIPSSLTLECHSRIHSRVLERSSFTLLAKNFSIELHLLLTPIRNLHGSGRPAVEEAVMSRLEPVRGTRTISGNSVTQTFPTNGGRNRLNSIRMLAESEPFSHQRFRWENWKGRSQAALED